MIKEKKYYDELSVFRGLIIVWVVIGHSLNSDIGGLFSQYFKAYAYSFHMPAFFMLSGFLTASKISTARTVKSRANLIKSRFLRLIVPYLFFTAVSYVLKFFLEEYAYNELEKNPLNILVNVVLGLNNPNGGIWFLYTLFMISVIFTIVNFIPDWALFVIFLGLKIATFFTDYTLPVVTSVCLYGVFFSTGILFSKSYNKLSGKFINRLKFEKKIIIFVITALLFVTSLPLTYLLMMHKQDYFQKIFAFTVCIFNIITWYFIAQSIDCISSLKKVFMAVGDYGMDIYMIGYYVQITIRVICASMLGIPYAIYSILLFVLGLVVPIPISKYIVRKVPLFRKLVLGDFSKKE